MVLVGFVVTRPELVSTNAACGVEGEAMAKCLGEQEYSPDLDEGKQG